jgi:cyanophycin synthetase
VLIDYAHNAHGLAALCDLVRQMRDNRLTLVLGLPGDRRETDIRESVRAVAGTFDRIIIRQDFDLRGREDGEVPAIIKDELLAAHVSPDRIEMYPDEHEAMQHAVAEAQPGDLIVFIADKPARAAAIVEELRARVTHRQPDVAVPAPS